MWMRKRMTWSCKAHPVKFPLNQGRGHGVTVLGAIGECLPKGVFSLARSTNRDAVMDFLKKLRLTVDPDPVVPKAQHKPLVMILDNHTAHKTLEVMALAAEL